jgi:hypothetical protein
VDFDVRTVKRSCVHIVSDDLRMIPFETMNLFYRDNSLVSSKREAKVGWSLVRFLLGACRARDHWQNR